MSLEKQYCVRSVQIRSFFWSEYTKIRTRKNSAFGHFSCSAVHFDWINTSRFFSNDFECGSNHMYCNLIGSFLQPVFQQCYLGCGSNRYQGCGQPSSTSLHHCVYIISCFDILLHYLTSARFTKVPPLITDHIFQHLMLHQGWSMYYFVA